MVIGPHWLTIEDADGGRRLDNELDYVRLEIESALRSPAKVVPVLVEKAHMPTPHQLPPAIRRLADLAEVEISDGRHWPADVGRLVSTINERLQPPPAFSLPQPAPPLSDLSAPAPSRGPPWRRIAAAGVLLLLAAVAIRIVAGWLEPADERLRIYSSLPRLGADGKSSAQTRDMQRAMEMALKDKGGKAGDREVVYEHRDASDGDGETPASIIKKNANDAADDHRTAVYIGDFNSDDSQESIKVLSRRRVAQISPTSTRTGLTVKDERGDRHEPAKYYPTGYRNFFRIIPNDVVQARALIELMLVPDPRPCRRLALVDDGSSYGRGLSNDVLAYNDHRLAIKFRQSVDEDGAYDYLIKQAVERGVVCFAFCGVNRTHTVEMFEDFADALTGARLFGTDGLSDEGFYGSSDWVSAANRRRVRIMVPPRVRSRDRAFQEKFKTEYDYEPEPSAVYGYEAMLVALDAIVLSGTGRREDVVEALGDMKLRRDSPLGAYTFDENGDTTLDRFGWSKIADSGLTTPRPTPRIRD